MTEVEQIQRISSIIDDMAKDTGTIAMFMGIPIEKFDKDRLIKLISIEARTNQKIQERLKSDYEFLGYLKGMGKK